MLNASIFEFTKVNKDATLQSVLQLLSRFLDEVKKQKLPYEPSNPGMLMNAKLSVEWGTNSWYVCTVDGFDGGKGKFHATYSDGDTRWYRVNLQSKNRNNKETNASSSTIDFYLENSKGSHSARVVKWFDANVRDVLNEFNTLKRYPMYILTHDSSYFNTLFTMIGRSNRNTMVSKYKSEESRAYMEAL